MKTKYVVASGVAAVALGAATILPIAAVSADETANTTATTFVQKLAGKLGLSTETVQTAVDSTREEIHTERDAERETAIANAVTAGTLTQRQLDILNAIDDARQTIMQSKTQEDREAMRDLTPEERKTQMDEELLTALNNAGLNTTLAEVTATREAARNANVMPVGPGKGMGRGGFGFGPKL